MLLPAAVFAALHIGATTTVLSTVNGALFAVASVALSLRSERPDYGVGVGFHTGWNSPALDAVTEEPGQPLP
jgi:hypothetical protein